MSSQPFSQVKLGDMDKWLKSNGGVGGVMNRALRSYAGKFMSRPGNLAAPVMHLMVGSLAIGYLIELPHLMGTSHTATHHHTQHREKREKGEEGG